MGAVGGGAVNLVKGFYNSPRLPLPRRPGGDPTRGAQDRRFLRRLGRSVQRLRLHPRRHPTKGGPGTRSCPARSPAACCSCATASPPPADPPEFGGSLLAVIEGTAPSCSFRVTAPQPPQPAMIDVPRRRPRGRRGAATHPDGGLRGRDGERGVAAAPEETKQKSGGSGGTSSAAGGRRRRTPRPPPSPRSAASSSEQRPLFPRMNASPCCSSASPFTQTTREGNGSVRDAFASGTRPSRVVVARVVVARRRRASSSRPSDPPVATRGPRHARAGRRTLGPGFRGSKQRGERARVEHGAPPLNATNRPLTSSASTVRLSRTHERRVPRSSSPRRRQDAAAGGR